ncbi:MAG: hypothetical protein L0216_11160 [Planctomycetales bacterium]|nr:hypothetical protein [Planctomycetales bacterium]
MRLRVARLARQATVVAIGVLAVAAAAYTQRVVLLVPLVHREILKEIHKEVGGGISIVSLGGDHRRAIARGVTIVGPSRLGGVRRISAEEAEVVVSPLNILLKRKPVVLEVVLRGAAIEMDVAGSALPRPPERKPPPPQDRLPLLPRIVVLDGTAVLRLNPSTLVLRGISGTLEREAGGSRGLVQVARARAALPPTSGEARDLELRVEITRERVVVSDLTIGGRPVSGRGVATLPPRHGDPLTIEAAGDWGEGALGMRLEAPIRKGGNPSDPDFGREWSRLAAPTRPPVMLRVTGRGLPAAPVVAAYRWPAMGGLVEGSASGEIWGPPWDGLTGKVRLLWRRPTIRDLVLDEATLDLARVRGKRGDLTIRVRGAKGSADLAGTVGTDGTLDVGMEASLSDLATLALRTRASGEPVRGPARTRGRWSGRLKAMVYDGTLEAGPGVIETIGVESLRADVRLAPKLFSWSSLDARSGPDRVTGNGRMEWAAGFALSTRTGVELSRAEEILRRIFGDLPFGASLRGEIAIRGRVREMSGSADLPLTEVRLFGEPIGTGKLALDFEGKRVEVEQLNVDRPNGSSVSARGLLGPAEGGGARLTLSELRAVARGSEASLKRPAEILLKGGEVSLVGPLELEGSGLQATLEEGAVESDGEVRAAADVRRVDLGLVSDLLGVKGLSGSASGRVLVRGPRNALEVSLTGVTGREVEWGVLRGASVAGEAQLGGGRLRVPSLEVTSEDGGLFVREADLPDPRRLRGRPAGAALRDLLRDPETRLVARLRDVRLGDLLARGGDTAGAAGGAPGPRIEGGRLDAELGLARGPGGPRGRGSASLSGARLAGQPLEGEAQVSFEEGSLVLDEAGLRALGGRGQASASVPRPPPGERGGDLEGLRAWADAPGLRLRADATALDLGALAEALGRPGAVSGRGSAALEAEGSLAEPVVSSASTEVSGGATGKLTDLAASAQGSFRDGDLRVERGRLAGRGLALTASGTIPLALGFEVGLDGLRVKPPLDGRGDADLGVELAETDVKKLAETFAWKIVPTGRVEGRARIRGTLREPLIAVPHIGGSDLAVPGVEAGSFSADGTVSKWFLDLHRLEASSSIGSLSASGRLDAPAGWPAFFRRAAEVGLGAALRGDEAPRVEGGEVVLRDARLGVLPTWTRHVEKAAGTLSAVVGLAGPLGAPDLTGRVEVREAEARFLRVVPTIGGLDGAILLAGRTLRVPEGEPLRGELGGGPTSLSGRVDMDGWLPGTFALHFQGRDVLLLTGDKRTVVDFRLRAHVDARIAGTLAESRVTGTVDVTDGEWRKDFLFIAQRTGAPLLDLAFRVPGLRKIECDLRARTPFAAVRVRNNLLTTSVRIPEEMRLLGPNTAPYLVGRAVFEGGDVRPIPMLVEAGAFSLQPLRIERGEFEFTEQAPMRPIVDGSASVRKGRHTIYIHLHGPWDPPAEVNPVGELTSQPPGLTQEEMLSYVLVGMAPEEISGGAGARNLFSELLTGVMRSLLSRFIPAVERFTLEAKAGPGGGTSLRAEFQPVESWPWLALYGEREPDGTYHGGLSLRVAFGR